MRRGGISHIHFEMALCVSFGARNFVHSLREPEENYVVSSSGFVGRLVGDSAGEVGGEGEAGAEQYSGRECERVFCLSIAASQIMFLLEVVDLSG
jgi:hypothetical protein